MGEGGGGGWGNEQEKMERGICRREEDRRVFFSDAACSSSAFFAKSCLFDQGYVVLCVALFFFSSFFFFIVALRFHAARFHGDNKRSMAARDRQISSLYDFCDFCSSVAFTVTRLSPHSLSFCIVNLNWIHLLPILFIISPLCLWQAGELSRPWYQPGEHHGYHCPLQPANGKQQLSHGQRTRSSLQYDAFRYTGLITNGKPLRTLESTNRNKKNTISIYSQAHSHTLLAF